MLRLCQVVGIVEVQPQVADDDELVDAENINKYYFCIKYILKVFIYLQNLVFVDSVIFIVKKITLPSSQIFQSGFLNRR